jgi:uroporphyrinogen-III synthase
MITVWVTREEDADGPLCAAVRACGLGVLLEPVLTHAIVAEPTALLANLGPEDWLVLSSPFAIRAVAECAAARVPHVAVVGEPSHLLAVQMGLRVGLVGADGHGETLFAQLRATVTRGVVCYPRSALAREPEAWAGVELRTPVLYETLAREFDRGAAERCQVAAVASPSAVKALFQALPECRLPLASIGRATSAAIRKHGREPIVEAAYPSFAHLAEAIRGFAAGA